MSTFGNNWNVKHNFNILRDGDADADAGVTPIALLILRIVELKMAAWSCSRTILNINIPTKTRDFQVLLNIIY